MEDQTHVEALAVLLNINVPRSLISLSDPHLFMNRTPIVGLE